MAKKVDIFSAAEKVAPTPEKKAKKTKEQIVLGSDLDNFSAAVAVTKTLEGVAATYEARIKANMLKLFASMGSEANKRPANFEGVGATSSASCELKKRASSSVLTEEEASMLTEKGIKLDEKVIREEAYLFNQAILADPVLRKKVSDALSKIDFGGISPILHQEREVKKVIHEESLDQLFMLSESEDEAAALIPTVGTLSIKPKFEGTLSDAVSMLEAAGVTLQGK